MKTKTIYVCQNCGAQSPRWEGKCASCDSWNSMVEESIASTSHKRDIVEMNGNPVLLSEVNTQNDKRHITQIQEFDNVMGGGVVRGGVTLIGGDPGIGKSTLSLQIASSLSHQGLKVLYISGEESIQQTSLRAQRLNPKKNDSLYIVNQVNLNIILEYINKMKPDVVIVDSIQVIYQPEIPSSPGSVSQVRECSAILTHTAKSKGTSLFVIGHVTKDGMLAGPRVLEHIVDTVLYFEGERYSVYRILRATKNRFGSTNEIGVFEMCSTGLEEVTNPSEIFLSERPLNTSGSVVIPIMEGTRPFLVEIQGLVCPSGFAAVRQKAQGFDANRLALLIAVLEKKLGLRLQDQDVFLNVVGGVRVIDPAADLAVVVAVASAFLDKVLSYDTVVLGEVGLSSEVRSVSQIVPRITEAEKLGFKKCIIPKNNLRSKKDLQAKSIEIIPVETVKETLEHLTQ